MQKISDNFKKVYYGGFSTSNSFNYMWNNALISSMLGQTVVGFLGMISQLVYAFNPQPKFNPQQMIDNSVARTYARIAQKPMNSTISLGTPFFLICKE